MGRAAAIAQTTTRKARSLRPEPRIYRGGSPPEPRRFEGNGKDPSAFTKWVRAMDSYRIIASPYLPPNAMALRVLDPLGGEALDEMEPLLEEHGIAHFDHDIRVQVIVDVLTPTFP